MRKLILIFLASVMIGSFVIPQRAEAFLDPVTIAILAPIALKVAEKASPYIQRGLISGGSHLLVMGKDTLEVLYLPLGFFQMTVGAPFGGLASGLKNTVKGVIAPGKLVVHTLLFPIALCGVKFN